MMIDSTPVFRRLRRDASQRLVERAAVAFAAAAITLAPLTVRAENSSAPAFDARGFGKFAGFGHGRINGSLIVRTANSSTPKAGAIIECYPSLPYTALSFAQFATRLTRAEGAPTTDLRLAPYARRARTDAQGTFHFSGLPRGRYLLRAMVVLSFARVVHREPPPRSMFAPPVAPNAGIIVYDFSRALLAAGPVAVGEGASPPPAFHLVARHDQFDRRH